MEVWVCFTVYQYEGEILERVVTSEAVATQWKEEKTRKNTWSGVSYDIRPMTVHNCAFDLEKKDAK